MEINLKKLIKISTVLAVSAAALISCSSDSEYGMLEAIVKSTEEATYTISKSSFNTSGEYFVSVEDDGIYKASYTSLDDDADSNILDHVKRELYAGTDDLTQILSIYTDENTSYVVYESADNITHLESFDNTDPSSSSLEKIDIDKLTGTFKNLTPNGYIITTEFNDDKDDDDYGTASLYIYSLDKVKNNTSGTTPNYLVKITDIYSDYGSSRYLDYSVYYKTESADVSNTANATADGLIISLTDSDDDNDDYVAADRYYYFSESDLSDVSDDPASQIEVTGGTDATAYNINIDADDDGDDAVNAAVVAAYGDANGKNAMIITSDGNCYKTSDVDTSLTDNTLEKICDVEDTDEFAVHLPSLFFNDSAYTQTDSDDVDYLIAMNRDDYIYVYYADSDGGRYSTTADIEVDYTDDLNNSSDIIYYAKIDSTGDVETYWVATADNGYYTIKIDTTGIIEDSDSHSSKEGFSY